MPSRPQERRINPWLDPRFLVQMLVMVGGVYVAVQVRTDRLEQSADGLKQQASKIEGQLQQIVSSVASLTNTATALTAKLEARERDIDDLKREVERLREHDAQQEKTLATVAGITAANSRPPK